MLALAAGVAAGLSAQTAPTAADLAQRIQAHYDSVKDFQADFEQTSRGQFTPKLPAQRGRLLVKKPGRMYMKYEREKNEYWSDGIRYYVYLAASKEGHSEPLQKGESAYATVRLLMGDGSLVRDFTSSMASDQPAGQWRLVLIPKRADPAVKSMVLIVDRASLKLVGLEKVDRQGTTDTWVFSNLKENVGLADKEFNRKFPNGTIIK